MPRVELNTKAPEIDLEDYTGTRVRLSEYRGKQNVVLVFNRGFV